MCVAATFINGGNGSACIGLHEAKPVSLYFFREGPSSGLAGVC